MRGIEAKLAQMAGEDASAAPFVARMQGFVAAYDMRRYMSALEGLARDG